jgi:hypothetical protein
MLPSKGYVRGHFQRPNDQRKVGLAGRANWGGSRVPERAGGVVSTLSTLGLHKPERARDGQRYLSSAGSRCPRRVGRLCGCQHLPARPARTLDRSSYFAAGLITSACQRAQPCEERLIAAGGGRTRGTRQSRETALAQWLLPAGRDGGMLGDIHPASISPTISRASDARTRVTCSSR